VRSSFLN